MTRQASYDRLAERLQRDAPVAWATWQSASNHWAIHVIDCDACWRGSRCDTERRLDARVVETAAFIREAGG